MAKKTPLHTVVQKIQTREISKDETAKYFTVAPNRKKPFDFNIGINTGSVDISNAPSAQAIAAPLLKDAGIALQFKRLERAPKPRFGRKLPLIAEGDSWFKLPDLPPIVPETLIDILQKEFSTINLAHWGDALAEMIQQGQFWPFLQSGSSDVLLFSGGGNDVLGGGELATFLELFDVIVVVPVMFPPGLLTLATSLSWTGSKPRTKTIGMVAVAFFAAWADRVPPVAAIRATRSRASSVASASSSSRWPSAQR
jgi:hypothetical protein